MGQRSDYTRNARDFSGENNPSYSHGHNKRGERTTEYEFVQKRGEFLWEKDQTT
jgi:hypothetical protein